MTSFNDFVHKYDLNNEATSIIKIYQVFSSIGLDNFVIYVRDRPFSSDIGIVILHPFEGNHWLFYVHEYYFASYGCAPPKHYLKLLKNEMDIVYIPITKLKV